MGKIHCAGIWCILLLLLIISPVAADTYLFVYSTPPGAAIYLDGLSLGGTTPREQHAIPGTYTLVLKKAGYPDYTSTITIPEGTTYVVNWDFGQGRLISESPKITSITPSSGAAGSTVSVTNLAGSNFASSAFFSLTRSGYPDISATGVTVNSAGTKMTGTLDLTGQSPGSYSVCVFNTAFIHTCGPVFTVTDTGSAAPTATTAAAGVNASISFETDPAGATVYLDNREIGTSPLTYDGATTGSVHVLIHKDGYRNYTTSLTVQEGKHVTFSAGLIPLGGETVSGAATTAAPPSRTPSPARTAVSSHKTPARITTALQEPATTGEESPLDPLPALAALALGIVVFRRS